ncbi:MAG: response regulator transcription factor [Pseudarcicella sp.]|nr:response regulator transcription factor [Pseudarcicella sp.]MBP6410355.1 response regulator transcription factor [Pseudarcicella sp.]
MEKIKILLVDDHPAIINGIASMLSDEAKIEVVAIAKNGKEALEILKTNDINIVLSDISMPEMDGLMLCSKIKSTFPDVKILMVSIFQDSPKIKEAVKNGADGYILKSSDSSIFIEAIYSIYKNKKYFSKEVNEILLADMIKQTNNPAANLTKREIEILKLIVDEYSNSQIADKLFISERTVETHRKNLYAKTNTKTPIGLMKYLVENQLD